MLRTTTTAVLVLASAARPQEPAPPSAEPVLFASLLDNGAFEEPRGAFRAPGVPWWSSSHGLQQLEGAPGGRWARTGADEWLRQPIAAYAPLARDVVIRGSVRGLGRVVVRDGGGGELELVVGGGSPEPSRFEVTGEDLAAAFGRDPVPRFELLLRSGPAGEAARWKDVEALVPLPLPSAAQLEAEIVAELRFVFGLWLERSLDREGPRATTFVSHFHDVVTGERLASIDAGFFPLYDLLLDATAHADVPEWSAALEAHLEDFLSLAVHPESGLPCLYDPREDARLEDVSLQIARSLGFLIDVAERGPEAFRRRALDAARRAGERVLERGVLPDGNVAPIYRPRDGLAYGNAPELRRLDVPAQLARLGRLCDDPRFADAAREALLNLEYTHVWAGDWLAIDPGFDDNYGHYGARAVTMWRAWPHEQAFAQLALSGWRYYAPRWREALRLGGNVAADQTRCWEIVADLAELRPDLRPAVADLLDAAVRSHFKGEQYGNGAWGDVTIFGFDPKTNLQVGDLPGVPQNLLQGLALASDPALGLDGELLRAMFTAVMRSSEQAYRRPYGYLMQAREQSGHNSSGGSIRLAAGLVGMLARL